MNILSQIKRPAAALAATIVISGASFTGHASAAPNGKNLREVTVQDLLGRGGNRHQIRRDRVTRRHIIGTWRIVKRNGVRMVLLFNRAGGFAMRHSSNPKYIIAGTWQMRGGHVRVKFLKLCNSRGRNCRALPQSKRHVVAIRIYGARGKTLRTSEGTMRPLSA